MQSQITIDRFLRHRKSGEYNLHAHEKLVMFFLASYMGKKSSCFPSIPSLATDCSLSVDSIKRAIKALENKRLLKITRISGRSNQYAFNLNIIEQPSAIATQCSQHPDADSTSLQAQKALPLSAKGTTNNNSNSINKSTSTYSVVDKRSPDSKSKTNITSDIKEIFNYWQEVMNHPKAKMDKKREQRIKNALNSYTKIDLKKAIDGCSNSPFHMGKNNAGQIYNDIELILRDSTHIENFINTNNNKLLGNNDVNCSLPEFMKGVI
ncbi:TPA: helix-turn-helix domain-containing protein [Legionella pneumophila]|nr:helix-turn-helix domain-containing protein [Legionella pneumophila]HAT1998357.1 helix-turn-helix domain-containing protein [Legionella pneumophila]